MAQSVGINTDGSAANASAMLDVSSTTKGLLPPRMTYVQKTDIIAPSAGLIVWCTDCGTSGEMQFFNGTIWVASNVVAGAFAKPGVPTSPVATADDAQASVAFIAPTSNGGSAITGYTVTSSPGGFTTTGAASPLIVTGIANGTSYTFTVVATNAVGNSVASNPSNSVTPAISLLNVTIGTQVWTNTNLDVATYRDGTVIPQVTDNTAWAALTTGAWCYYNNDPANGAIYGKLYNWYAVAGIWDEASKTDTSLRKKLAPVGWHIPTDSEWTTLTTITLGGTNLAGGKMKATGTSRWTTPNTSATNESGFTGLPGGYRDWYASISIGDMGQWWSSSELVTADAYNRYLHYTLGSADQNTSPKYLGLSVRCIRD